MKIKALITLPETRRLINDSGIYTIKYESEIEIDEVEIDRILVERLVSILKKETDIVEEETRRFVVDNLFGFISSRR